MEPMKKPLLVTANKVLSILVVDYLVDKVACHVWDDGVVILTFEALSETSEYARKWVPFNKKFYIEPQAFELYFAQKVDYLKDIVGATFIRELRAIKVWDCSYHVIFRPKGKAINFKFEIFMKYVLGYGTWLCLFLWKDMVEMYDKNDGSRKRMSFQKIDTLTWIVLISFFLLTLHGLLQLMPLYRLHRWFLHTSILLSPRVF